MAPLAIRARDAPSIQLEESAFIPPSLLCALAQKCSLPRPDNMDTYLRKWRQDALNRGQHDAAIYIGDKVLALTSM